MMAVEIAQIGVDRLAEYAAVPIRFEVTSRLCVEPMKGGLEGVRLREVAVDPPYTKDYDETDDSGPLYDATQFDLSKWGLFLALAGGKSVGAAAVAMNAPGLFMVDGRREIAVLWDIRVRPGHRAEGVGTELFTAAADWARAHGATQLRVETQNINVPACRFYARMGCRLGNLCRHAYAEPYANEAMLEWYLDL
jgi:GNAT superfamily N-acetyltransferase